MSRTSQQLQDRLNLLTALQRSQAAARAQGRELAPEQARRLEWLKDDVERMTGQRPQ